MTSDVGTVVLRNTSDCAISTLAAFRSLATCDLQASGGELDLTPLHKLMGLTELRLHDGRFATGELASDLTYLSLNKTQLICAQECKFASTLEHLVLIESSLHGVHSLGLSAFTALKRLLLDSCEMDGAECLDIKQGDI